MCLPYASAYTGRNGYLRRARAMARTKKGQEGGNKAWYALAVARILVGFIFLWAFIDKVFGFGFATKAGKAWINGVSPTSGFLAKGVNAEGPLVDFYHSLAGSPLADWLFMIGLLGIGLALIFGMGLRVAAVTGTALLAMLWLAELPLANNPIVDEHIIYIAVIWIVVLAPVQKLSATNWWRELPYVKQHKWLW